MKIYTRKGDDGTTGLVGGGRIAKTDARMDAIGTIDELNATLGWVRVLATPGLDDVLGEAQHRLFDLGAELATPPDSPYMNETLGWDDVAVLEHSMDAQDAELEALKNFILPGGTELSARLQIARSVCRRAERSLLIFAEGASIRDVAVAYVNRLSDWLFVAARTANHGAHVQDVKWSPKGGA